MAKPNKNQRPKENTKPCEIESAAVSAAGFLKISSLTKHRVIEWISHCAMDALRMQSKMARSMLCFVAKGWSKNLGTVQDL
jgi:hypothetical protein